MTGRIGPKIHVGIRPGEIRNAPSPDRMLSVIEGLVTQYAYYSNEYVHTGGLSVLEDAFDVLGWDDPHHAPERACQREECREEATCGTPTDDGYSRLCGRHYMETLK